MARLHLVILTPRTKTFEGDVDLLTLPTKSGQVGILADHYPLIATIPTGVFHFVKDNVTIHYAISGGVISVQKDKTLLLAEALERPDEIDIERAKRAKERAETLLASKDPDIDIERAQAALMRALNRIHTYETYR